MKEGGERLLLNKKKKRLEFSIKIGKYGRIIGKNENKIRKRQEESKTQGVLLCSLCKVLFGVVNVFLDLCCQSFLGREGALGAQKA